MFNSINRNKILILFFFFFLFLVGLFVFDDYGIGIDEDNSRINGFVSLKYIFEILNLNFIDEISGIKLPSISGYDEQGNGVIFDLPLAFIEFFFNINDFRDAFLIRHLASFLVFYISLIYFYKLILDIHNSKLLGILGVLMLFATPRIFAQSFFNPKDVCFMALCIINLYYGFKFLNTQNVKSSILFSLTSGLAIGSRILGILIPILIIFISFLDLLRSKDKGIKKIFPLISFMVLLPLFAILFWPFLWSDPLNNFFSAFQNLSNHYRPISNLFMGTYISSLYVPWYYTLTWIVVTTPLLYLLFFLLGFFSIVKRLFKRLLKINEKNSYDDLWRGNKEKKDLIFLLIIIIPLFAVIILHSSLYSGWRHFYFIYPSIILISIQGIYTTSLNLTKYKKLFFSIIFIFILPVIFWMIKNHPYQYVYFNSLIGSKFDKYFDMDYWGVSNYNALNYLLKKNKGTLHVGIIGNSDLGQSRIFLDKNIRDRIIFTHDFIKADFLVDNYNRWNGIRKTKNDLIIENNFKVYFDMNINNVPFTRIYKNNFK
tara:strand:- start:313 stop:1938 length:1626 start_codon:yes stop_codon:yes gene_type:complete